MQRRPKLAGGAPVEHLWEHILGQASTYSAEQFCADPSIPVGMLKPIADSIADKHGNAAQNYILPYMARAFDNGKTYADSKSDGLTRAKDVLSKIAAKCSGIKFTITGYSQGADIAGDLASEIGNGSGPIKAEQVLAVALLADPGSGTNGEAVIGPKPSGKAHRLASLVQSGQEIVLFCQI